MAPQKARGPRLQELSPGHLGDHLSDHLGGSAALSAALAGSGCAQGHFTRAQLGSLASWSCAKPG